MVNLLVTSFSESGKSCKFSLSFEFDFCGYVKASIVIGIEEWIV